MTRDKIKKLIIMNIPYVLFGLLATKLGEAGGLRRERTHPKSYCMEYRD